MSFIPPQKLKSEIISNPRRGGKYVKIKALASILGSAFHPIT